MKRIITIAEVLHRASLLRKQLPTLTRPVRLFGVPRGGAHAAHYVARGSGFPCEVVYEPEIADVIVDDLVDSGATRERYKKLCPHIPFIALFDKQAEKDTDWLVFPWETETESAGPEDAVIRLLQFIGEDPRRGGLLDTPKRVIKAWEHWTSGYSKDVASVLKTFDDGAENVDEMVVVKDIPFYTHCEHHMAPFFGTVSIAYIPNGKIVGLSKMNRVVDIFARRLQVQERFTTQIADAIHTHLQPLGVAVRVEARHMCMESRGVCQNGHKTVTSALRGVFKEQPETRAEFFALCNER